ncbi:hypothetical protein GSH19_05375 [Lactobacillus sp. S2-2]|uniref:YycH family regulatory protein n=1 Tax=Lactobacillus sp. S2-2 TaxID=2692917 RepID=UPI001F3ED228|nr:two-component system activity regulator YycH [Lactobacillus sp. S2-2]MCF6515583.1 hypothetical protein [Lactobacillus sp. S2-2]
MLKKIRGKILPLLLAIVIGISLVLSAFILINPSNYSNANNQNESTELRNENSDTKIHDLYAPTQVIQNWSNGQQYTLTSETSNVINDFFNEIKSNSIERITAKNSLDNNDYFEFLKNPNQIMLNYESKIPFNLTDISVNKTQKSKAKKVEFNRIIVPLNNKNRYYLLNDDNKKVYELRVKSLNYDRIYQILNKNIKRQQVQINRLNNKPFVYYQKPTSMKVYAYLLKQQTQSFYTSNVFGNSNDENVKRRQNRTIYSNQNQILTFNDNDIRYNDYRVDDKDSNYEQELKSAYYGAINIGVPIDNSVFYGYDKKNDTVNFRNLIESYPIFSQKRIGTYTYHSTKSSKNYQFSDENFQVPIPSNKNNVKLPNTNEVLSEIAKVGINIRDVSDIKIGYQTKFNKKNNLLVSLVPTWFINYQNNWYNYNQLLSLNNGGDSNGF